MAFFQQQAKENVTIGMTNDYLVNFKGEYLEKDLDKKCKDIIGITKNTIFVLENKQNDFCSRWVL